MPVAKHPKTPHQHPAPSASASACRHRRPARSARPYRSVPVLATPVLCAAPAQFAASRPAHPSPRPPPAQRRPPRPPQPPLRCSLPCLSGGRCHPLAGGFSQPRSLSGYNPLPIFPISRTTMLKSRLRHRSSNATGPPEIFVNYGTVRFLAAGRLAGRYRSDIRLPSTLRP